MSDSVNKQYDRSKAIKIAFIVGVVFIIFVIGVIVIQNANKPNHIKDALYSLSEQYGLENVSVTLEDYDDHYEATLYCSNLKALDFSDVIDMHDKMYDSVKKYDGYVIIESDLYGDVAKFEIYDDEIRARIDDTITIFYDGWKTSGKQNAANWYKNYKKSVDNAVSDMAKEATKSEKCCICGKTATNSINSDYYCASCYYDMIEKVSDYKKNQK